MGHLSAAVLHRSPLVHVLDVACRAPAGGCGAEEHSDVAHIVVPRRGVFELHRRSESTIADVNTVVLFAAGETYRVSHPAAGGDRCTVLGFAPELLDEALGPRRRGHWRADAAAQLSVHVLVAALGRRALDGCEADEASLLALDALAARRSARASAPQRRRAEQVRALLASRPAAPWRLDAIARAAGCSPFHLARQFRAATGETIGRHLVRLRLALALDRIAEGEDDLARLAVDLGFAHQSHFGARFRAVFGVTPGTARATLSRGRLDELRTIVTADPAARA